MARKRFKFYVGRWSGANGFRGCNWFASETPPTAEVYGKLYSAIIGPFKTKRGAIYMQNNPSTPDVETAERYAKMEARMA